MQSERLADAEGAEGCEPRGIPDPAFEPFHGQRRQSQQRWSV